MKTEKATHTPGQLSQKWIYGPSVIMDGDTDVITEETEEFISSHRNEEDARAAVGKHNQELFARAAAPELLEALKLAIQQEENNTTDGLEAPWIAPARAAIAKATGQTP